MTRPEIRGILGGQRRILCKFCPTKFDNFDQLRFHAQSEHQRAFHQVNRSLAVIDAKLRSLESVAADGLKGIHAGTDHSYEASYGTSREGWWQKYVYGFEEVQEDDEVVDAA